MKVELLACTADPMLTMYRAWTHHANQIGEDVSPGLEPNIPIGKIFIHKSALDSLWSRWIVEPTSAMEFVHLSFLLLGVSRAFLAQITRHRMLGMWVQSMRTTDMSDFEISVPDDVLTAEQRMEYMLSMRTAQECYKGLLAAGVSLEIARDVIPLGSPTNIAVAGNLRAWAGLIRSRACLMAQQGMWAPVLREMRRLMVVVEPRFADLFRTPCEFTNECLYRHEQENRISKGGADFRTQPSLGVCPVFLSLRKFHGMCDVK